MKKLEYDLPEELIAKSPAEPRDHSRLFVYDTRTDEVTLARFYDLPRFIPRGSLLVVNDSKVAPARVELVKETGGKVEALFLVNEPEEDGAVRTLLDREAKVGSTLSSHDYVFDVIRQDKNIFHLRPRFEKEKLRYFLDGYGRLPLPKYLHSELRDEDAREKYQTVYAQEDRSVAAPTAGLHFTEGTFAKLREKDVSVARATLHVGLGTFAPLSDEHFAANKLHAETFSVSAEAAGQISAARKARHPIVAVGTTSVRVLESAAGKLSHGEPASGQTDIFIHGTYQFQLVDHLITNFHLPGTSLLHLVDSFLRHKGAKRGVLDLYEIAIREKFRFYSFGDSMLIL